VLVCDSKDDTQMTGQARKLFVPLACPRDFHLFTREEGAAEHGQMGAMNLSSECILDGLDRTLAARP